MEEDYDILETNFRRQNFPQYYQTLDTIAEVLDAHKLFNTDRPAPVPDGERFRAHKSVLKELSVGADRGDSLLKEQRQSARYLSEIDLHASASYLKILAIEKRDPTVLTTSGWPLKDSHAKSSRKSSSPQAIEIHLEVKHVKGESGAIVIMASHIRNGGPYLINLCKGEPVSEESWYNPGGHYSSCRRIEIRGLEPANKYYVRIRTDGPEGPGNWSHPVAIIVL
jgi:hypothetical protein